MATTPSKSLASDLTVDQVAQILGVHRNTVIHLVERGTLPAYRLGPRSPYRFRREIIIRFRAGQSVRTTS